jgi:hypothetical protein
MDPSGSWKLDEEAATQSAALPTATVGDKELEIKLMFRTGSVVEIEHGFRQRLPPHYCNFIRVRGNTQR